MCGLEVRTTPVVRKHPIIVHPWAPWTPRLPARVQHRLFPFPHLLPHAARCLLPRPTCPKGGFSNLSAIKSAVSADWVPLIQ